MTNKEKLTKLYEKFNLTKEDVFKNPTQGWTIITRGGIDKIQAQADINISYEVISSDLSNVVIKATGTSGDASIETFGEASPKNTKNGYPFAIAEKRAMSRVVLKLSGFYSAGVFGEDEWDDASKFVREEKKKLITGTL